MQEAIRTDRVCQARRLERPLRLHHCAAVILTHRFRATKSAEIVLSDQRARAVLERVNVQRIVDLPLSIPIKRPSSQTNSVGILTCDCGITSVEIVGDVMQLDHAQIIRESDAETVFEGMSVDSLWPVKVSGCTQ